MKTSIKLLLPPNRLVITTIPQQALRFVLLSLSCMVLALIFTIIIIQISVVINGESLPTDILFVHWLLMVFPLAFSIKAYLRNRDFFDPAFIAGLTFMVYQLVFNPFVATNFEMLYSRQLETYPPQTRNNLVFASYSVVAVSWFAFWFGYTLIQGRRTIAAVYQSPSKRTLLFLILGVSLVTIGVIGNIGLLGGLGNYITKIRYFYERPQGFDTIQISGSTKYIIFIRCLPVGLLVLAFGNYLYMKGSRALLMISMVIASVLNMFLSSATGGRGYSLMVAFYSIVLYNYVVKKLNFRQMFFLGSTILVFSFIVGIYRSIAFYGSSVSSIMGSPTLLLSKLINFVTLYLSEFLGTLKLVEIQNVYGVTNGLTAFSGLKGLLGGATPLTSTEFVWQVMGISSTTSPIYGPPGDLYLNYGFPGVIIGMIILGIVIKILALAYRKSVRSVPNLFSGIMVVFTSLNASYLLTMNLHSIPAEYTYLSASFYLIFGLSALRLKC